MRGSVEAWKRRSVKQWDIKGSSSVGVLLDKERIQIDWDTEVTLSVHFDLFILILFLDYLY